MPPSGSKYTNKSPPHLPERSPQSTKDTRYRRSRSRRAHRKQSSRSPSHHREKDQKNRSRSQSRGRRTSKSDRKSDYKSDRRSDQKRRRSPGTPSPEARGRKHEHHAAGNTHIKVTIPIPPHFKPDEAYLDTTVVKGFQLPRKVTSTSFTEENGTAGIPVQEIPLPAVTYGGLDNWGLRYLASGKQGFVIMSRHYREASLLTAFSQACRDQDVDLLLSAYARSSGLPYSTTEEKAEVTTKAAKMLLGHLQDYGPQKEQEKLLKRIAELETQQHLPAQPTAQQQAPAVQRAVEPVTKLQWQRKPDQDKYLNKSAPTSAKIKDVNSWFTGLKLNRDQKSKAMDIAEKIQDEVDKKPITERGLDHYRACVVDWGLPFGTAAALDSKSLFKILGAVVSINNK